MRRARGVAAVLLLVAVVAPGGLWAQRRPDLQVRDSGSERSVPVARGRGYAAVRVSELASLGWEVTPNGRGTTLTGPDGTTVTLADGSPFFRWDDEVLQLTDAPYVEDGELLVPLQLLSDFLPRRLPDHYAFDGSAMLLTVGAGAGRASPGPSGSAGANGESPSRPAASTGGSTPHSDRAGGAQPEARPRSPRIHPDDGTRVVVIDAGHGGEDPGSISRSGIREKNVALGVALAMADALKGTPGLEVHLTRDHDTFPPIWSRGAE
ncbi:MAG: N-acetylmuramoyl-L-alanine amidase, partial [Gemmatimonadota bacterium]